MSHTVARGSPDACQLYLDKILDAILQCKPGKRRDQVNLTEVLYHCMRTNPELVHSINALTNEKFTNGQILKRAISVARAVTAACEGEREKPVIVILPNHEHMAAVYYAMLLAGVVPFMMEPNSTEYELQHFFSLISPALVFCEPNRVGDVTNALRKSDVTTNVVAAGKLELDEFTKGHSDDVDSFQLPDLGPDSSVIMLPTSGSTGLPKAAVLHHRGLVMHLPVLWRYHTRFPQPTRMVMLLSTVQWMTHTIQMISCPVYQVPILLSPKKMTVEYIVELAKKYRPTWAFCSPSLMAEIGYFGSSEQISSLETLLMGGAPFSPESMAPLEEKLPASSRVLNAYGSTEAQGFVAFGSDATPLSSIGKIINIFDYKLVDDNGEAVTEYLKKGELYLKSKCMFKGFYKNQAAYDESFSADGWFKTGDIFYSDENDQLFFVNRNKIGFKYFNHQIYPEEVERVVTSVPGVQHCVVCGTDAGPTAAVVLFPGQNVSRENIHQAISSTLSDYNRLRGGIAFVPSLPRNPNGKVVRASCAELIQKLVRKGECVY